MSSLKTLYRAVVMVATAIIVFKGWQIYGPTTDQLKTGAGRALEIAQQALNRGQPQPAHNEPANLNPSTASPMLAPTPESAVLTATPDLTPGPTQAPPLLSQSDDASPQAAAATEKLPALMSRLEKLGAAEPKLASWGSTGKLFRFCCRAKLDETAACSKHFESVADEPAAAVEQVVAKVEEWRLAQNSGSVLP